MNSKQETQSVFAQRCKLILEFSPLSCCLMHKSQTQINPDTWYLFSIETKMWFCLIHHVSWILQSFKQGHVNHEQHMMDSILIPKLHPPNPVSPLRLSLGLVGQSTAGYTVVWQGWHARIAGRPTTGGTAARILRKRPDGPGSTEKKRE